MGPSSLSVCPISRQIEKSEFENWILEQRRRRSRIVQACKSRKKHRRLSGQFPFYYNKKHNLLFCFQHKVEFGFVVSSAWDLVTSQVGSTTWLNHFISLEEKNVQEKLESLERPEKVRYLAPEGRDLVTLARTSFSISMVGILRQCCLLITSIIGETSIWTTSISVSKQGW